MPVSRYYLTTAGSARPPAERSNTCPCHQPVTHSFTSWSAQRLMGMLLRHSRELKVTPWCSHSSCGHWEERAAEVGAPTQQYSRSALQAQWEAHVMFQGPLGKGQLSGVVCRPIKPVRAAAAAAVPAGWWQPSCGLRQQLPHSRARQLPQHSCACSDHPATRLLVSRPSMLCASKALLDSAPGQPWQAAKGRFTCL